MTTELNLRFPDKGHVIVRFGPEDEGSGQLPFTNPITDKDVQDIRWYIETYGAHSLGDPDDKEANRIQKQLPIWGKALFNAVFVEREAQRRFTEFQDAEGDTRLITISAEHPRILALPWELLHDASVPDGTFLFHEQPSISIRRRVADATKGRRAFNPAPKDSLHLLFVVSRPDDAGFIDPRADSSSILDAIDQHAPGRVTCEFLRPPTLDALNERLSDTSRPPVDILHFDGHGVFDRLGNLPNRLAAAQAARMSRMEAVPNATKPDVPVDPDCPPNMGYLLFEKPDSKSDFVSADKLGSNLHRHKVALIILSACQSAMGGDVKDQDDQTARPMGSVAARLTATGIPSVLAMTHSVLVHTTKMLFGEFYKELARHKGTGEALDQARRYLANHPEKYDVQRGPERVPLKLYDWFLPALYQQGADTPLLKKKVKGKAEDAAPPRTNLPRAPEAGFFGRRRDLWQIERWFAGPTRRVTITGFGGQGKTAVAQEAGRWLTRTRLFDAAVFVDYSRVQAADAVAVAKNEIGKVLDQTFIDAAAATAALKETDTLVILDNLEVLAQEVLRSLLDVAVQWSEAGNSRVLCTTRRPEFGHADYKTENTRIHRRIVLDGLGKKQTPDDALEWYAALMKLPPTPTVPAPKRGALIELFDRVKFHPLSIRVLAQQLKTRRVADIGDRLEKLLLTPSASPAAPASEPDRDTPSGLLASLELSLDTLDASARAMLPRLGVFQGGAFEDDLIAITGLGDGGRRAALQELLAGIEAGKVKEAFEAFGSQQPDESKLPEVVADFRAELAKLTSTAADFWPGLRRQLETAALIEAEDIPGVGVPFIRFHPTLGPMLSTRLEAAERQRLTAAYRRRYYVLSRFLYDSDRRHPQTARAIAWRDLPNLLHAVHAAFDAGDPNAADFSDNVHRFLSSFGLKQEAEDLSAKAQAAAGDAGTEAWYLVQVNKGDQLLEAGRVTEAMQLFEDILQKLGDAPTFKRVVMLRRLTRILARTGRLDLAVQKNNEAVSAWKLLDPTVDVRRLEGLLLTDKADILMGQGQYAEARQAYQDSLEIKRETGGDLRDEGAILGQLGNLAMLEGNLTEALERFQAALVLFQQLREPATEAVAWHQLGRVFQEDRQWEEAERHYREAARIKEENGIISGMNGAATSWHQLAVVSILAGKPDAAEMWFRKAIEVLRASGENLNLAGALNNLGGLVGSQPGRLAEARQLLQEALAIKRTLDPSSAQTWKTYGILAETVEKEAGATADSHRKVELETEAREYRRLAREAQRNFAGTRHELRKRAQLILSCVNAAQDVKLRERLEQSFPTMEQNGWVKLVAGIRRVLAGERDTNSLCADLDTEDSMLIEAIVGGIADPASLSDLMPTEPPGPQ